VRRVAGRVVRPGGDSVVPAAGAWVTLHRVGADSAAPLDSSRTGPDGRYAFRYRPFGSEDAIYFVSAQYAGIAYFSPPLRSDVVTGEDAEVTVFDTTSSSFPLSVRGRHVIVSSSDASDERTVIEVFELANDSTRTLVGGGVGETEPTWSAVLPAGARNFKVGQGDVPPDAVTFDDGRVLVFAPFAPGLKQISFSYTLPRSSFPLTLPISRATGVLEVLVEEPTARATASGARLAEVAAVSVDGRNFKRFLAQNAPANGVLTVDVPGATGANRTTLYMAVVAAIGAAMLLALARAFTRRTRVARAPSAPAGPSPERLAREIADLDVAFERRSSPGEEERAAYQARRGELKAQLTDALARRADAR